MSDREKQLFAWEIQRWPLRLRMQSWFYYLMLIQWEAQP